jgi:hypothetical protein
MQLLLRWRVLKTRYLAAVALASSACDLLLQVTPPEQLDAMVEAGQDAVVVADDASVDVVVPQLFARNIGSVLRLVVDGDQVFYVQNVGAKNNVGYVTFGGDATTLYGTATKPLAIQDFAITDASVYGFTRPDACCGAFGAVCYGVQEIARRDGALGPELVRVNESFPPVITRELPSKLVFSQGTDCNLNGALHSFDLSTKANADLLPTTFYFTSTGFLVDQDGGLLVVGIAGVGPDYNQIEIVRVATQEVVFGGISSRCGFAIVGNELVTCSAYTDVPSGTSWLQVVARSITSNEMRLMTSVRLDGVGTNPTPLLVRGASPWLLYVDAFDGQTLWSLALDGSAPRAVAKAASIVERITVAGNVIYFSDGVDLYRVAL